MIRIAAWAVFLGALYYGAKFVDEFQTPWASMSAPALPALAPTDAAQLLSPSALRIPGCGDKPECLP